jgi:hypothetical protein
MDHYRAQVRPMIKVWKQKFEESFPGKDCIVLALIPDTVSDKTAAALAAKLKSDTPVTQQEK